MATGRVGTTAAEVDAAVLELSARRAKLAGLLINKVSAAAGATSYLWVLRGSAAARGGAEKRRSLVGSGAARFG